MGHGISGRGVLAAIGKGVWSNVENSHHQGALT